jgi:sulfopropanediol 3-dehydrogenase
MSDSATSHARDAVRHLKRADAPAGPSSSPEIRDRVSEMLLEIEAHGMDAVRRLSRELDRFDPPRFRASAEELAAARDEVAPEIRERLELGRERVRGFAELQLATVGDLEREIAPGIVVGHRHVPVGRVGAYLPAGHRPLTASAFMTVLVPKVAGVATVIACTPPRAGGPGHPTMLHTADRCGADGVFSLGGVQAMAAMAFGLEGEAPVDMIVGAGNAWVTEAKRQLFGRVGIDLLAGPSEIMVIADDEADPELVAADLLGQAEHGPSSPASLVCLSERFGRRVLDEVERQLDELDELGDDVARRAWHGHGIVAVAADREEAAQLADAIAPEHLEVHAADEAWWLERLTNYGSLFLGSLCTVAFSDKGATGTNHVLPTGRAARYSGGLSALRFLKTLTYQRVTSAAACAELAAAVQEISRAEELPAHAATATRRLARLAPDGSTALRGGTSSFAAAG